MDRTTPGHSPSQARIAWGPILTIAAIPLTLQLSASAIGGYGIFRDEYYYLACARRLAWGYVDQPPFSIALLAIVRSILGDGVLALRLLPALCAPVIVVLTADVAARLGGRRFAQVVAAVAAAGAPVMLAVTGFYSMNAFDLVFWAGAWALLVRLAVTPTTGVFITFGALLGVGLMNKIGLLVLGAALAAALVLTPLRRVLRTRAPYVAAALAVAMVVPHLLWQAAHGWATVEFIANAQRHKIVAMAPFDFLREVALEQQPVSVIVWMIGLGWLLAARRARPYRVVGLTVAAGLLLLIVQRAKPYYAAGLFPALFAAGACAWEDFTAARVRRGLRPILVALLAATSLFMLPMSVPILPVETFARWQAWTGIAPAAQEVGHSSQLPQHYSDRFGWTELAAEVSRVAASLAPEERAQAVIIARNYGEAGALEYWRERYRLPPVVSGHNNYFFWAPPAMPLETVLVVGWSETDVRESFADVVRASELRHPWALEAGVPIWIARRPTLAWPVLLRNLRSFI